MDIYASVMYNVSELNNIERVIASGQFNSGLHTRTLISADYSYASCYMLKDWS